MWATAETERDGGVTPAHCRMGSNWGQNEDDSEGEGDAGAEPIMIKTLDTRKELTKIR